MHCPVAIASTVDHAKEPLNWNKNGRDVNHVKIELITRSPEHGVCYTTKMMMRQNYCEIHTRQPNNKATMTSVF